MFEEVEVTTEGVREPPSNARPPSNAPPPRWTRAFRSWSDASSDEAESVWSDDDSASAFTPRDTTKRRSSKRGMLICLFTVVLAAIIAGVVVAVVVPMNNDKEKQTTTNVFTDNGESPTAAPTVAPGLGEECTPAYNNVDYCLTNELTEEEGNACIDCVWEWLPANNAGQCQQTEAIICNILSQCGCGACAMFLEEYLDCQSSCEFDCNLDTATERVAENHGG